MYLGEGQILWRDYAQVSLGWLFRSLQGIHFIDAKTD